MEAGSGHIGTSFSVMEILCWLHLEVLTGDDACFSSKGHDAPAVYAVLAGTGKLDFALLHRLRRLGGLPGHPDIAAVPAVTTNTGSLGMGVSKAKGLARAARLRGETRRVFVVTGDGELQEGQFWESLGQAANEGFGEITVIVDHNKIQSDTWVDRVSDIGDVERKAAAFGWATARCDGNDVGALADTLGGLLERAPNRPKLLVADTVKGAGVGAVRAAHAAAQRYVAVRLPLGGAGAGRVRRGDRRAARPPARPPRPRTRAAGDRRPRAAGATRPATAARRRLRRGARRRRRARATPRRARCRPRPRHRADRTARTLPGALRGVRDRRAGHGQPGGRAGARRAAAGGALVRLLPHAAGERADLQQRDRGHEDPLLRLARRHRARRPRPLAPGGARHRA